MGLFKKGQFTPFIASIINIVLSIILGKKIGLSGIFFATSIAQIFSYLMVDPYMIYKYELRKSMKGYYIKLFIYLLVYLISGVITYEISNMIIVSGIKEIVIKSIIVLVIPNLIYYCCFSKSKEFTELKTRFLLPLLKKINIKTKNT